MKRKKARLKKVRRVMDICAMSILIVMFYLIGSAGGLENNAITLTQFAIRTGIGFTIITIAFIAAKRMKKLEQEILSYQ